MNPSAPDVLVINGGSSSIKFTLFEAGGSLRRILEGAISSETSRIAVRVIHTDEEWMITSAVCRVLGPTIEKEHYHAKKQDEDDG